MKIFITILLLLAMFVLSACGKTTHIGFNVDTTLYFNNGLVVSEDAAICDVTTEVGKVYLKFCHKATSVISVKGVEVSGFDTNLINVTANYDRIYVELNDAYGPVDPMLVVGSIRVIGAFNSEAF